MDERELLSYLALNRVFGSALQTIHKALLIFESSFGALEFMTKKSAGNLNLQNLLEDSKSELERLKKMNAEILVHKKDGYPNLLSNIQAPPLLLMKRGIKDPFSDVCVAVVGSRNPSEYGKKIAYRLAFDLAANEITIVSGFANGIDAAAHRGALDAGGRTIAVLGTGLDVAYPKSNLHMGDDIIMTGAQISEFSFGVMPSSFNFPRRNRVISGLSKVVVVVEAAKKSGSLITARYALEQGRELCAVPGHAGQESCAGSNNILKEGAFLIECPDDVLELLSMKKSGQFTLIPDKESQKIYTLDELIEGCNLPANIVQTAISLMVIDGQIEELPGACYRWRNDNGKISCSC